MRSAVEFEVLGIPAPQGSKKFVGMRGGRGIMVESSKGLRPWRDSVAAAARRVAEEVGMFDCPLHLSVEFRFPMPKSRPKKVRDMGIAVKTTMPDLSKLVRGLEDGLQQGGLIRNDSLIWRDSSYKVEVIGWTGAIVRLSPNDPSHHVRSRLGGPSRLV